MMKYTLIALLTLATLSVTLNDNAQQYVDGYYRSNGTHVQGYYQSTPDGNPYNNYSTRGNVNPYTGAAGTVDPYSSSPGSYNPGNNNQGYSNHNNTGVGLRY